uniref:Odorant receptor 22c n=2 Tax=Cacopsylla melanoneura TaxID=428564 RepID=A0A8D9AN58_9HEMI
MLEYDFQCLELKERTDILTSDINKIQVQSVTSQYDEKTRQPNRFVLCEDKHRMFVRHLIQSHQKIIDYETKIVTIFRSTMFRIILVNGLLYVMSLYQITLFTSQASTFSSYKSMFEFLATNIEYFYFCYSSEALDDCYATLRRNLYDSPWYNCSLATRKDLIVLLRRLQRPNYLKFKFNIMLSNAFFLQVLKRAYSFVNCMRARGKMY